MLDEVHAGFEDLGGASVIPMEDELLGIGKHPLEVQDIGQGGPGEGIDGLPVVTHHEKA
jgi:hypothetical protein